MFCVGETVVYSCVGVCKINDICENKLTGVLRKYYVLKPVDSDKNVIYVPIDNEKLVSRMRVIPTKNQLEETLKKVEKLTVEWIDNNLERTQVYRDILSDGEITMNISLLRTLHKKHKQLLSVGRHLPKADERIYKECSRLVSSELSTILSLEPVETLQLLLLEG